MARSALLLDTHVFLWWRTGGAQLSIQAREAIAEAPMVLVSAASAWEIAIKITLGRLKLPEPVEAGITQSDFTRLGIRFAHAEAVSRLPFHHRDPFDRMLVAQAIVENLVLVTGDRQLGAYDVSVLWAR